VALILNKDLPSPEDLEVETSTIGMDWLKLWGNYAAVVWIFFARDIPMKLKGF
jgi:hypothetical protein